MSDKTIYIFDMDDTLLTTPTFADFVKTDEHHIVDISGDFNEYFIKLKGLFSILFSKEVYFVRSRDYIVVYDFKTKSPLGSEYIGYFQDLDKDKIQAAGFKTSVLKELPRMFDVKGGMLILQPFPGFHGDPKTLGNSINEEVYSFYKNAANKAILTGRDEKLRPDITKRLSELGIELPNYGLFLYSGHMGVSMFKIQVIEDLIRKNGWTEVHFFEDRKDWLDKAAEHVHTVFPNVLFHKHFITNVKNSLSL